MSLSKPWRPYQREADEHISFTIENKRLVKMFCGTGKSLLMRYGKAFQGHSLCVYVFPSLSLIEQFNTDYLEASSFTGITMIISSEEYHTTKEEDIYAFLQRSESKIICVTYQSFHLLKEVTIPMCVVDEAHHVSSETYFPLFLENPNIQKACFFTATPKKVDYGSIAYEYSYLRGVAEGYLNPFEIRVDLVGEDTNRILYESIARAYFTTGNNRILTFHADVNTDSPTSVRNFVNPTEIQKAFDHISKEFSKPTPTVHVRGFYSEMKAKERRQLLNVFDASQDVFLLSSCETMGEGVDTKNANMCVFVDPKSSFIKIIQNIGRIVRKQFGVDKPHSTILLPIYIQKEKYEACTTAEECDARIREDMSKGGDFTPILNVLSALRQEDEDLYEICLHYPNEYSPQEIEENLRRQGCTIGEEVDIDEVWERVEEGAQLDVHSSSLEEPIVSHGESEQVINVLEGDTYYEIIGEAKIQPPGKRVKLTVHTNADVQVLWRLHDLDLGSCLMDCEVIDNWNERLEEVKTFMDTHKRRPSQHKEYEHKLGYWISHQIKNYKEKTSKFKIPATCKKWEVFVEEYKEYFKTTDEIWNENLQKVKLFIDTNKRTLIIKDDKSLYNWLRCQLKTHKTKSHGFNDHVRCKQWEEFLEEYKEYLKTEDEKWDENLQLLKTFMNIHKKRPTLKDDTHLCIWLQGNIYDHKTKRRGLKDPLRCKQWEEFVEKYKEYLNTDEKWFNSLQKVKEFINRNKRRPNKRTETEKTLGIWLVNELKNYKTKTKGFKDTIRCKQWEEFLEEYKEYFIEKKSMKLVVAKPTESLEQRQRVKSELSTLHQLYKTMRSDTLYQHFIDHPTAWSDYHTISESNEASFPEESIPRNQVIRELDKLRTKRPKCIVDMGCGKALIAKHFQGDPRFTFINIDHVAVDATVQVGDISKLPLEEDTVEICILSLALWGSNCKEYIREAHRVLETNGILYLIEPTKRWTEKEPSDRLREALNIFHVKQETIEKFSFFTCIK
jgi:superfamily II DNA or RNA helicase